VAKCRELKIAGATVFLGLEGYGETAEMHKAHLVHSDRPIVITIVDTAENIERLVPVVAEMMDTGLMASSEVQMIRVEHARLWALRCHQESCHYFHKFSLKDGDISS